jgi:hypothetical protein
MKVESREMYTTSFRVKNEAEFEREPLIVKLIKYCLKENQRYKLPNDRYVFTIKTKGYRFPDDLDRKFRDVVLKHNKIGDICMIKAVGFNKGKFVGCRLGMVG